MDTKQLLRAASQMENYPQLNLLELPIELFEEILNYLTYDQISQNRLVCRMFNRSCSQMLNRGFTKVEKFHHQCLKKVKSQLPRRESERRTHPLSRHCEILSAIETRLSLLSMTYLRYVEANLCCFIPGKVLDEIYRVLRFVQNNPNPPRIAELLQELRDISSMAMEFFEEKIVPTLKAKMNSSSTILLHSSRSSSLGGLPYRPFVSLSSASTSAIFSPSTPVSSKEKDDDTVSKLSQSVKSSNVYVRRELAQVKSKLKEAEKQMKDMTQTIKDMQAQMSELNAKMREHDKHRPAAVHATDASNISNKSKKEVSNDASESSILKRERQALIIDLTEPMDTVLVVAKSERRITRSTAKKQKL